MKLIIVDVDLIDKYMSNKLSEEEISLFQERLRSDYEFKEQYEYIRLLKNNLKYNSFNEKLSMLQELEVKLSKTDKLSSIKISKKSKRVKLYYILSSAAAVILLLVFMLPGILVRSSDIFIDENFNSSISHTSTKGSSQKTSDTEYNAYKYYSMDEYEKAISYFLILKENGDHKVDEYLVSAFIKEHQYEKAQQILDTKNVSSSIDVATSEWFHAFIILGKEGKENAIALFNKIINSSSPYKKKSVIIVAKLTEK